MRKPTVEELAFRIIRREEGYRDTHYRDSVGLLTIGVGHRLMNDNLGDRLLSKMTNRGEKPLPHWVIQETFLFDLEIAARNMKSIMERIRPAPPGITRLRKAVLISMAFQMGETGLRNFHRMWRYIAAGDWLGASEEALNSKWAREDSPKRAHRHADMLRRDTKADCWPDEYPSE